MGFTIPNSRNKLMATFRCKEQRTGFEMKQQTNSGQRLDNDAISTCSTFFQYTQFCISVPYSRYWKSKRLRVCRPTRIVAPNYSGTFPSLLNQMHFYGNRDVLPAQVQVDMVNEVIIGCATAVCIYVVVFVRSFSIITITR